MDAKELYNAHAEQVERLEGIKLLAWDELPTQERMDWEYAAMEQDQRDRSPENEYVEVYG